MSEGSGIPRVEVAVVLLMHDGRVLTPYNRKWGAFTLPMTKRRHWEDPNVQGGELAEAWDHAAYRAAGECLGRTLIETLEPVGEEEEVRFRQSDRNGKFKFYIFHVYRLAFDAPPALAPGVPADWLTREEILDEQRHPISKTARELIRLLP